MRSHITNFTHLLLFTSLSVLAILRPQISWAESKQTPATSAIGQVKLGQAKPLWDNPRVQQKIKELSLSKSSLMGTKDGGGGDTLALEFQNVAQMALSDLQKLFPEISQELVKKGIRAVIENAKVLVVDDALDVEIKMLIQTSVAFNSPEAQTILVNRIKWTSIPNENLKKAIALHEILSLMSLERTGSYPISTKLWSELSVRQPVRQKDIGPVPMSVYICATSSENMIGIGVEYQISLALDQSSVIYSQFSLGNIEQIPVRSEIGRTRRNFPAVIKNQGSQYYIQSRHYNAEDASFRDEDMILDTQNLVLGLILVDGRLLPIPCKLISKY